MKTIINQIFFKTAIFIGVLSISQFLAAKDITFNRSFNWDFNVDADATISLSNYNCDVAIETSSSNTVVFEITIDVESKDQEDIDVLIHHLENRSFPASSDLVKLETVFWDSKDSKMNNSLKMKLKNGKTVNLTEFRMTASLRLPKTASLELNSKYSRIDMSDINKLTLDCFNDKVYGENVFQGVEIKAKYTSMEFQELGPTELDMYDCRINANKTRNLNIKSKYSDIVIDQTGHITMEGYNDNMTFETNGDIELTTKYSDFKSKTAGNLNLEIYDSDFEIDEIKNLTISDSKYSAYTFEKAEVVDISASYNDVFDIDDLVLCKVGSSKYSDFIFNNLDKSFDLPDGYNDNIKIYGTSSSFMHLSMNSKYGDIIFKTDRSLPLKIDWKTKYGNIDLDESSIKTRIKIKENSEFEYHGYRGSESANSSYVKIRGYDVKMKLIE